MQSKKNEVWVGLFVLIAIAAIIFLALKVADIRSVGSEKTYRVSATFDDIGGLQARSPVKIGGVVIGRVNDIRLDKDYKPEVTLDIYSQYDQIPDTSSLSIRTSGLLGEQYLALSKGFENTTDPDLPMTEMLKDGSRIQDTKPAMVLEDLIGQFLYKSGDGEGGNAPEAAPAAQH
ncbi:outer membrane lipid asymmetry maintenance protein MlaD [Morganella morganii]|uniref:outer membrane lipid asymmetry maintenance protein MlaD n=1 Tax=Morganella morganii TaxID=582 RepID=UPI001A33F119|nr:outer membrane lipid asymmetry maintenance protein MlaD [Morganella morganii]MCU6211131.1 outer membrane lipid asymmetry maintenance protein MlaD [Morganella morganii]MCU6223693.1 outer membrane lipid asymmetry maintenance protein MlaD [Morganella morganii]MCU6232813.1 outer membrane lipid asymmetry maintenance protein MlaD [Morganella morganii]MCU6238387.1 outer membrane lipid asymmetry maintenance protein MlaD [Morganella morganii]MCU6274186.1 outer membrane lipid asymmetry maintenance pr